MARLAQSSEFTILRTGGLGPGRALGLLAALGLLFGVLTFVRRRLRRAAQRAAAGVLKARFGMAAWSSARTGAWLQGARGTTATASAAISINVAASAEGGAAARRAHLRVRRRRPAGAPHRRGSAHVNDDSTWTLQDVTETRWAGPRAAHREAREREARRAGLAQHAVGRGRRRRGAAGRARCRPSTCGATSRHLAEQEQAAQSYQILFWKRALYPFACLVMVGAGAALRLPARARRRRQPEGLRRHHAGHQLRAAEQRRRPPRPAAATGRRGSSPSAPSVLYLLLSLAAFSWLVRYR